MITQLSAVDILKYFFKDKYTLRFAKCNTGKSFLTSCVFYELTILISLIRVNDERKFKKYILILDVSIFDFGIPDEFWNALQKTTLKKQERKQKTHKNGLII